MIINNIKLKHKHKLNKKICKKQIIIQNSNIQNLNLIDKNLKNIINDFRFIIELIDLENNILLIKKLIMYYN